MYAASASACYLRFNRVAEKLAGVLGSPAGLPSRAASAMLHALAAAAATNGHTFLPWQQLQRDALKLMSGIRLAA